MTSYTLQVQPRRQYSIQYANERGPQGPAGSNASATTDASLLVSGTLADARLSANVALENVANVFTAKQSFSGTTHVGLCLNSLTTAEYTALTATNGDLFRDSTTDRIDARLARGTVELVDTAGGQVISGSLAATTLVVGGSSGPLLRNNAGQIEVRNNANSALSNFVAATITSDFCRTNVIQRNFTSTIQMFNGNVTSNFHQVTIGGGSLTNASGIAGDLFCNSIINQTGTAGSINILINRTETALGSGAHNFADFQVGGSSRFSVSNTGNLTASGTVTLGTFTVGTLPSAAANTRALAFVTDSNLAFNSTNLGSTVTAGGSTLVPVFSNGTNWVIG